MIGTSTSTVFHFAIAPFHKPGNSCARNSRPLLDFDEIMKKSNAAATNDIDDLDDDFYGSEGYNDDDIDLDGYDINNIADSSYSDDLY